MFFLLRQYCPYVYTQAPRIVFLFYTPTPRSGKFHNMCALSLFGNQVPLYVDIVTQVTFVICLTSYYFYYVPIQRIDLFVIVFVSLYQSFNLYTERYRIYKFYSCFSYQHILVLSKCELSERDFCIINRTQKIPWQKSKSERKGANNRIFSFSLHVCSP